MFTLFIMCAPRGSHCGGMEICRQCDPPQAENLACEILSYPNGYGSNLLMSLGNNVAYLTLSYPNNLHVNLSNPRPKPP